MTTDANAPSVLRPVQTSSRSTGWWALLLVATIFAAYARSLSVPFFFDDIRSITENPSIRNLAALGDVLSPPRNSSSVNGRPLVNLSLALNYAVSGERVAGYHATNIALHAGAALILFGLIRRTLQCVASQQAPPSAPALSADRTSFAAVPDASGTPDSVATSSALRATADRSLALANEAPRENSRARHHGPPQPCHVRRDGTYFALALAAVWALHPLQTESVTCVVQRTEVLVALFYLLTLYGLVRFHAAPRVRWAALAIGSCWLGMASKEVMVTAPVVALLLDRTFLTGTFRRAWATRRGLYVGFAASWLLLGVLVLGSGATRGTAAGFGLGMAPLHYAFKQSEALVHYARLALWPYPLVVDYGTDVVTSLTAVWPQALGIAVVVVATVIGLVRRTVAAFFVAAALAIIAPSSSIVPLVTQTMAEHRVYLPLAPLVVGLGCAVHLVLGARTTLRFLVAVAAAGALVTATRNATFRDEITLWTDTIAHRPQNPRAHISLANAHVKAGQLERAVPHYQRALDLDPLNADAHANFGSLLRRVPGGRAAAIEHLDLALRLRPRFPEAHVELGSELLHDPARRADAIAHFETALTQRAEYLPERLFAAAHFGLGVALSAQPDAIDDAIKHYEAALALAPDFVEAHFNLANLLATLPGRTADAIAHYETVIRLAPQLAAAPFNLGNLLLRQPDGARAAATQYEAALRRAPDYLDAWHNLGLARLQLGENAAAARAFRELVQRQPDALDNHLALASAAARAGDLETARAEFAWVLRRDPAHAAARHALAALDAAGQAPAVPANGSAAPPR